MRYKEFNPNAVLEKCIALFWKTGFRGAAISDIVDLTGVNRFSLYEEFGSKEGILQAALRLYKERYSDPKLVLLDEKGFIPDVLENFYMSFLRDQKQEGCFVIHVGTELADTDQEIKVFLESYMSEIEVKITQLLNREYEEAEVQLFALHLVGLFYTSMSFCLIQTDTYRSQHIRNGINVILSKKVSHA